MRETTTYNHSDIQRYLQKQMTPAEMHEFEKALMDDPFLADAIEGYAAADNAVAIQHLQEIEKKVRGNDEKAKVLAMPAKRLPWLNVAAVLLVLVCASVITYSLLHKNLSSPKNIAQNSASSKMEAVVKEQDSIKPADKSIAQLDATSQEIFKRTAPVSIPHEHSEAVSDATVPPGYYKRDTVGIVANEKAEQHLTEAETAVMKDEIADSKISQAPLAKTENDFKGKVVNQSGEPVAYATVLDKNKNLTTTTNAEGKFTLKSPDTAIKVDVNSVGYASANATLKSNKPANNIVLQESEQSLSEVVVTSTLRNKKAKEAAKARTANAEPEGGWQNFRYYLNNKVDSIKATYNSLNQDVTLEFSIDKNGQPKNIKTQNKVDKQTEEAAKQILLNGPKWTNNSSRQKVVVTVPANGQ